MLKFICRNCGAVNLVDETTIGDDVDWLDCLEPDGFEWKLPAGKITPVIGDAIYISATGEHLSRERYIRKYNIDPEKAYKFMRSNRYVQDYCRCDKQQEQAKASPAARTGNSNSGSNLPRMQEPARASPPIRSVPWADEEDWV